MQFSIISDIDKKLILSFKKASTTISFAAFKTQGRLPPFSAALKDKSKFLNVFKSAFSKVNSG